MAENADLLKDNGESTKKTAMNEKNKPKIL